MLLGGGEGMTAESWRVAQIVVERGPGDNSSRGSGYLVAPGLVLTAAHVVAGASVVWVRLDVGQPTQVDVLAEDWWADREGSNGTDLAVVRIAGDATAGRDVEQARFGRISDCMAVLAVQAFGFPRFKLRDSPANKGEPGVFRDLEQVSGHAPVAANRRQGTLAVYLDDPPPAAPEPGGPSPWSGMSGAAVWSAARIVGVVAEHHPGEGTGRLTARRIDRAYAELSGLDIEQLVNWLGLAPAIGGLPDVVPARPGQLIRSAYLEQVRDIAPDALIGRDGEIAEWAEFCAGPNAYAWWQAGPWAGKTALAAWFVTHPPAGADIVLVLHHRPPGRPGRQRRIPECNDRTTQCPRASRRRIYSGGGAGRRVAEPAGIGRSSSRRTGSAASRRGGRARRGRRRRHPGQGTAQHRLTAPPPPSRRRPGHRHQPSRSRLAR